MDLDSPLLKKEYLTINEAAEVLGIKPETLRNGISQGKLSGVPIFPTVKQGFRRLVKSSALKKWMRRALGLDDYFITIITTPREHKDSLYDLDLLPVKTIANYDGFIKRIYSAVD